MLRFNILTLFPEVFSSYAAAGILGRAQKERMLKLTTWNIRDFATDKHRTVDDAPYGGGAGMVMKIEPIDKALAAVAASDRLARRSLREGETRRIIVLSARGAAFTQAKAQELSQLDEVTLICGRYEGIDQRVADYLADEELSIGRFVLAGGELAALVVIEVVARLIPGVLGNPESLKEESFGAHPPSLKLRGTLASQVEYPHYTKPEDYKGLKVPEVLLSGNHAEIKKWREEQSKRKA